MSDGNSSPALGEQGALNGSTERQSSEEIVKPIAIVGMSCRFPGDASSVRGLWEMCCNGRNAWSEFPKDRMNGENYWHPNTSKHGSFNAKGAHFLREDVALFDAPFFNISPNEASAMDPQQRLLLEVTYEALENAGIPLKQIVGQDVGVFVGGSMSDYQNLLHKDIANGPIYQATGTAMSFLANRISYIYDLKGPSVTVDTACSSGLTALHLACQSIRTGEIRQALVGGVYIILSPENMIAMSMLGLFGTDGLSYSYDHRATGYGRGEGGGMIVLKSLDDAIANGDTIHAVIRHTGTNQDGKTSGPTMPSLEAQERLIKRIYSQAGLDPLDTDYVEAHGTGTAVGDPIEASAIARSLARDRPHGEPLYIGSVKSNIGHLEAGSGLAGIIKASLVLQNGLIPPNVNFEKANEEIPFESWKLKVPTEVTPWPSHGVRRASLSSFGFGGTNVHVILENASRLERAHQAGDRRLNSTIDDTSSGNIDPSATTLIAESCKRSPASVLLFKFSAAHKEGVKHQMAALTEYLQAQSPAISDGNKTLLADLAYTLSERRTLLEWRATIAASTVEELIESMDFFQTEPIAALKNPSIAFVFTGQGSQWRGMSRNLMRYPAFATIIERCEKYLQDMGAAWSLLDMLQRDDLNSSINSANISQPATTAIQIALVSLLATWNVNPVAVLGHSSGEIAAAFTAGALSLCSCMAIAYHRGELASKLAGRGAMIAVGATVAEVTSLLGKVVGGKAVIACINSPSLITVSGDIAAVDSLQTLATVANHFVRRLKVDTAYHSHHMKEIEVEYLTKLGGIEPSPPSESSPRFHSSLRGKQVLFEDLGGTYWSQNLTSPVLFSQALTDMCLERSNDTPPLPQVDVILEIGPHSSLKAPIQETLMSRAHSSGNSIRYLPTLIRNSENVRSLLHMVGALHCLGYPVNGTDLCSSSMDAPCKIVSDLPQYPWLHTKRYWHETRISKNNRFRRFPHHDLLGALAEDFNDQEPRWKNTIRLSEIPWLSHHLIQSSVVFPFAAYVSMACEAAFQRATMRGQTVGPSHSYKFREIFVKKSLILAESSPVELSCSLRPHVDEIKSRSSIWDEFCIYSHTEETGWSEHCSGLVSVVQDKDTPNEIDGRRELEHRFQDYTDLVSTSEDTSKMRLDCSKAYNVMARAGMEYGSLFRNIVDAQANVGICAGTLVIPDTAALMPRNHETPFIVHPTMLDSCLHIAVFATCGGELSDISLRVPTYVKSIRISHQGQKLPGQRLRVYASAEINKGTNEMNAKVTVFGHNVRIAGGGPEIEISEIKATKLPGKDSNDLSPLRGLCFKPQWEPCLDLLCQEQYQEIMPEDFESEKIQAQSGSMERAAYYYTQAALATISTSEVGGFLGHHQKLYRVLKKVSEFGTATLLPSQMAEWRRADEGEKKKFIESVKNADDCGQMMCTVGEQLPQIFRKEIDPLSIMFSEDMLEKYYSSYLGLQKGYAICSRWIGHYLSHQNPAMKILEIGAGTGSTTIPVLQSLSNQNGLPPRFGHFYFTDISAGFFRRAKERLGTWGELITYRTLDIEKDPIDQGFENASFDLILASNVLHATANMNETLKNTRKLLRDGGRIIILESTTLALSQTILFGTIPGWWAGEEHERQDGPTLNESQWDQLLRRTGFSGLDGSLSDNPSGVKGGSAMISTATFQQSMPLPSPTIIVDQYSDKALIRELQSSFAELTGQDIAVKAFPFLSATDLYCVYAPLEHPTWRQASEDQFNQLRQMILRAKGVLWVTKGAAMQNPDTAMSTGVARVVRSENAGINFVMLDLDGKARSSNAQMTAKITTLYRHQFQFQSLCTGIDSEYLERDGVLHIQRAILDEGRDSFVRRETRGAKPQPQLFVQDERLLKLKLETPGRLDSLYFTDDDGLQCDIGDDQVEIEIKAAGVNFRDVMIGLAQVPHHELGSECSGVVHSTGKNVTHLSPGDRVCGLAVGTFGHHTRTPSLLVSKIPEQMSFAIAATIPVVFCTALYSLRTVARLQKGESILVHAAAGGVGQAAIMLSKYFGAQIFVSVGSTDKKDFIKKTYGIPESQIFSSRDTTFETGILRATNGRGIDVVLNSLAGEGLKASWRCIAPLGRFVEIGKADLVQNSYLEMKKFLGSVTFAGVDLTVVAEYKPELFNKLLTEVIELYQINAFKEVAPITSFGMSEVQDAMRLMQGGKHMGKIIIQSQADDIVKALPPTTHRAIAHGDASYLIAGGTGGIGRSLAYWLVKNGARHIVLISRSGMSSAPARAFVEDMKTLDAKIKIVVRACDVGNRIQLQDLLKEVEGMMPPIKGVIHGAMVLQDVLFENSSFHDWTSVIEPRVAGAWNLHHCLPRLDFFVILASLSGIVGTRGQAAYAATNTFLDSFAAFRRSQNLPASTIDIGAVEDVGYVAEAEQERQAVFSHLAHDRIQENELFAMVKDAIVYASSRIEDGGQVMAGLKLVPDKPLPFWAADVRFSHSVRSMQLSGSGVTNETGAFQVGKELGQTRTTEEADQIVMQALIIKISKLSMTPAEEIVPGKPLAAYGLDSLVAIEMRNWLIGELDVDVPLLELMNSPSLTALAVFVRERCSLTGKALQDEAQA